MRQVERAALDVEVWRQTDGQKETRKPQLKTFSAMSWATNDNGIFDRETFSEDEMVHSPAFDVAEAA